MFLDNTARFEGSIPRRIHQTTDIPHVYKSCIDQVREMNPGWAHTVYTDADCRTFLWEHFPGDVARAYDAINSVDYGVARADLFRYCVVYKFGGVYLDVKSCPDKDLDSILLAGGGRPMVSRWAHPIKTNSDIDEFQNWHLIYPPGHPILLSTISTITYNIRHFHTQAVQYGKTGVLALTGPYVYTDAVMSFVLRRPQDIVVFRRNQDLGLFYCTYGGVREYGYSGRHVLERGKSHYSTSTNPIVIPYMFDYGEEVACGMVFVTTASAGGAVATVAYTDGRGHCEVYGQSWAAGTPHRPLVLGVDEAITAVSVWSGGGSVIGSGVRFTTSRGRDYTVGETTGGRVDFPGKEAQRGGGARFPFLAPSFVRSVAVVVRSYDRPGYLAETVQSILCSGLGATPSFLYIWDDGSRDEDTLRLLGLIRRYGIRVLRTKTNLGCEKSFSKMLTYLMLT